MRSFGVGGFGEAVGFARVEDVLDWEVVVIGSGAAGGMTAWNRTRQGVNVLLLDAGTRFNPASFWSHVKPWEWDQRIDRGQRPPQFRVDPREQPIEFAQPFELWRVGRSVVHQGSGGLWRIVQVGGEAPVSGPGGASVWRSAAVPQQPPDRRGDGE